MPDWISAHTPLRGNVDGDLIFKRLTGRESLSALYRFSAEFLSKNNDLDLNALLGQDIAFEIMLADSGRRFLHGHITGIEFNGYDLLNEKYKLYTFTLHPALWYLTQNRDCRIWQEKNLPDIITAILAENNIVCENRLTSAYRLHSYIVQYQESAFDFLSRLMEHEGIYYFFQHHARGHTLVLADSPQAHQPFPGYEDMVYRQPGFGLAEHREGIHRCTLRHEITPGLCSMDDYDFRQPRAHLAQACRNRASFAVNKTEIYDWPGRYDDNRRGQFLAQIRQQALEARQCRVSGLATARGMAPGCTFRLHRCPRPRDEQQYLVTGVDYEIRDSRYQDEASLAGAGTGGPTAEFSVNFTMIPAHITWRPPRTTPWPKTQGPQTAEVAGPQGHSIWTDKYGRVKLKFRWDRRGAGDDTDSCWVRVSSHWAGWKYGGVQVPRVGEEVIVDFINGDPDRPIIIGRVYNEDALPPWELPAAATRMGCMSRSKDGGAGNASYWFMEDAPGRESFSLHAERDMTISVEHDKNIGVDGDLAQEIGGRSQFIHRGPCATRKFQPDMQTFHLGKTSLITAGGRADAIGGGEYRQVTGHAAHIVSGNLTQHAGHTLSHHALGDIMFDAGNKIVFGQTLYPGEQAAGNDNSAHASLAAARPATPQEAADRRQAEKQRRRPDPTRVEYAKGVETAIHGVDRQDIAGDRHIEVRGNAGCHIHGRLDKQIGQDLTVRAGGDISVNGGNEVLIATKKMTHKIEGSIETHSGNALNVTGSAESISSMNFSMAKMAVKTDEVLTSSTRLNLATTAVRVETVGVNIGQGQLDIRTTLLSLHTSAITIFI
ncbi:type VI secretion system Vgr family protein [Acerihabitans arboris]|uniref:Type VI secretion system tip protein VgrG n=1 Tax=Acerihabitans arboris TaxID=2691583 RepID=A0A845SHP3_9GAMM|nr:type VI secretion system tip protein TssI/VgrG [Acerihabitans arboris]NDL64400.1 type VI secretion system tip protein VgrG [Acerihabitans arboris]